MIISRYTFKDLRIIYRLSIDELAEHTKISSDTLLSIEFDSSNAKVSDIATLAHFYGLSVNYIYLGKQSDFKLLSDLDKEIE